MVNEINNVVKSQLPETQIIKYNKPRLRWKTGLILFFLSLYYFYSGSLRGLFRSEEFFFLTLLAIIPSTLIFLVYVYTAYRAEKAVLDNRLDWKWITKYNILLALIMCIPAFLFIFIFLAIPFALGGGERDFESFILKVTYSIGFILIIFSIIPSAILRVYYYDRKKFNTVLLVFLAVIVSLSFGYKWISEKTCNFGTNTKCLIRGAEKTNDFKICEKIKHQEERNKCYYNVAYDNNSPQACEEIDDSQYNDGRPYSRDDCYYNVFLRWDLKDKALCYKISNQEIRNSCLTSVAGNTGDDAICQSEELNDKDKQRCLDEIAKSSARLKKDPTLCENIKSSGIGASMKDYCYSDLVFKAGVKEAEICKKIDDDFVSNNCFSYVAKSLKNIDICSDSRRKDVCVSRYNEQ